MSVKAYPMLVPNYEMAQSIQSKWHGLWQDCYDYALPLRGNLSHRLSLVSRRQERLYDGTALDAVDQLASMMLGYLTPPLTPWFGLKPGTDISPDESRNMMAHLERSSRLLQSHIDQSNFTVEIHQCFLDLVVSGTASLVFEEAEPGELSAFHFSALPLHDVVLDEGSNGKLDIVYRKVSMTSQQMMLKYNLKETPLSLVNKLNTHKQSDELIVIEAIYPVPESHGFQLVVFNPDTSDIIFETHLANSPFINFRWMKSPGEIYGRSPVMKALPDIKTANKVVELILKNASIAVTGIWQADDDGVLNVANIELVPGAIIPKAVGSKGLTPLEMPSRFDVSQLVLQDLRNRIRDALLVNRLSSTPNNKATATEISIRNEETTLLLGATFGRLQVELLNPLIQRAYNILRKRGAIPDWPLDGRTVAIDYRSPLTRAQSAQHAQSIMNWVEIAQGLGPDISNKINREVLMGYMTDLLGVPSFLKTEPLKEADKQTKDIQ
jgi:hypothetical protein